MAKKKRKIQNSLPEETVQTAPSVPSFEIGTKGDDFDKKYRRAAADVSLPADKLLSDLSRESKADKYNFIEFAIPAVLMIIISVGLVLISRGDIEEMFDIKPSVATVASGEYTKMLDGIYNSTVPFGDGIKAIGSAFGFCDRPVTPSDQPDTPKPPEEQVTPEIPSVTEPTVPEVTEPEATTSTPATTTVPETTEEVTVATTEPEPEEYDTFIMYAKSSLNVRLGPSTDDAILGYYNQNSEVNVIAIRDDSWAEVLYNGIKAYVFADYLSEREVEVTTKKTRSRTESTTAEATAAPDEETEISTEGNIPDSSIAERTEPESVAEEEPAAVENEEGGE